MKADPQRLPRFAVLIDADNTSPQIAGGLFEEVAKFGEASVRRIYGDFSTSQLKSWSDILQKYAIDPYQQFTYTKGKNASDIALVSDAMDLLHSGRFDGFCLVSSDSDFTRLASRLREQGADVYGFGAQKTPESFRQACRRFIYTENLVPRAASGGANATAKPNSLETPSAAIPILQKAISQIESEDGWVLLGTVGEQISNLFSDFDARTSAQASSATSCAKPKLSRSRRLVATACASGPSPSVASRRPRRDKIIRQVLGIARKHFYVIRTRIGPPINRLIRRRRAA